MNYFICGFMGAGKTTLLQDIRDSDEFPGYDFIDLDNYILKTSEFKSIGELIKTKGFSWFRKLEKEALLQILAKDKVWLALGGGTLDLDTVDKLNSWTGYWLDTDFETCYQRISHDPNRPLASLPKEKLLKLFNERKEIYSLKYLAVNVSLSSGVPHSPGHSSLAFNKDK